MIRTTILSICAVLLVSAPLLAKGDTAAPPPTADSGISTQSTSNDFAYRQFVLDSIRMEHEQELERTRQADRTPQPESIIGVFIPIVSVIAVFLFLWRSVEAKKKIRIAMVERGMDPGMLEAPQDENSRKFGALRWGMLLAGIGLGLLIGFLISLGMMLHEGEATLVVISSALVFGGAGLIGYHVLARKMDK